MIYIGYAACVLAFLGPGAYLFVNGHWIAGTICFLGAFGLNVKNS